MRQSFVKNWLSLFKNCQLWSIEMHKRFTERKSIQLWKISLSLKRNKISLAPIVIDKNFQCLEWKKNFMKLVKKINRKTQHEFNFVGMDKIIEKNEEIWATIKLVIIWILREYIYIYRFFLSCGRNPFTNQGVDQSSTCPYHYHNLLNTLFYKYVYKQTSNENTFINSL